MFVFIYLLLFKKNIYVMCYIQYHESNTADKWAQVAPQLALIKQLCE